MASITRSKVEHNFQILLENAIEDQRGTLADANLESASVAISEKIRNTFMKTFEGAFFPYHMHSTTQKNLFKNFKATYVEL